MKRFLLTILAIALVTAQDCTPSASKDLLVTGTKTFTLTSSSTLQCFNLTIDAALAKPQLTAGLQTLSNYNYNAPLDFSLRNQITGQQALFTLITNNPSWTALTVTYILASRNNFYLGNYLSSADSLANCQRTQPYALTIPLPASTRPASSSSLAVLILLNGIRTNATQLSLQFSPPTYDSALGQINTTALTSTTQPIELIYFGYILVDLAALTAQGYTYSFSTSAIPGQFVYAGAVAVGSSGLLTAYFSINRTASLTCLGTSCTDCQSPTSCLALGGQVVANQCVRCAANQTYSAGVGCVCSTGTYLIGSACGVCPSGTTYQSVTKSCVTTCPANSYYTGSACVCSSGYYSISGSCQTCPANSYYTGSACACTSGYYNISGSCTACPSNSYFSGLGCVCNSGYYNISGTCQTCPSGTTYSAALQSCIASCGQYQTFTNNACQCISGYVNVSNQCYQTSATCGTNKYLLNGVCKCLPNLFEYYGGCYSCPDNSDVTADQSGCMCRNGYTLTSSYTCALTTTTTVQSTSTGSTTATGTGTSAGSTSSTSTTSTTTTTSTASSSGGTVNLNGGASSSGTTYSGTSSFYGTGNTFATTPTIITTTSTCGATYSNGTCRPQTTIVSNQSVLILNAVYVNVIGSNLPESITSNNCQSCSSLLLSSLQGSPAGVTSSVSFIPGTTYQWVGSIVYQSSPFPVTLQLKINPVFSSAFTVA